jgi:hypothetical protein
VDNSVLRCANSLAQQLGQGSNMVRLALLPAASTAAADAAAADTAEAAAGAALPSSSRSSNAQSLSTQQQQQQLVLLQCYLLPPELPTDSRMLVLSRELREAVKAAATTGPYNKQRYAIEVRSLVDVFRLCNLTEQQRHWQQQRRPPGELVLKDISVTKLDKNNQPDSAIAKSDKLLQEASTMRAADLCMGLLFVHGRHVMATVWRYRHDSAPAATLANSIVHMYLPICLRPVKLHACVSFSGAFHGDMVFPTAPAA